MRPCGGPPCGHVSDQPRGHWHGLQQRQEALVTETLHVLEEFIGNSAFPAEVGAETLRRASDTLGRLTGKVGVEDLLDVIFSQFCIGK